MQADLHTALWKLHVNYGMTHDQRYVTRLRNVANSHVSQIELRTVSMSHNVKNTWFP